ncbi:MAG: hypothetical protein F6K58_07835 [Symploca sp. SIO2E9]|nr:hypothetical protein [Symploca sp. SIO2E9]
MSNETLKPRASLWLKHVGQHLQYSLLILIVNCTKIYFQKSEAMKISNIYIWEWFLK